MHATISRGRSVYTRGLVRGGGHSLVLVMPVGSSQIRTGHYTLALRARVHGRAITRRMRIALRV